MITEKDKYLLSSIFQHSDFTVKGRSHHLFRGQVDRYLANNGELTDDVLSRLFIRNYKDVAIALRAYPLPILPIGQDWEGKPYRASCMPFEMYYYIIEFIEGKHESTTNNARGAAWADSVDVVGIFIEFTERFKLTKTEAYELIADNLSTDGTLDADTVRRFINRRLNKIK